jgi:hypothetical protein
MIEWGIAINLQAKVKVVSRSAEQPFYPKSVGSRGFFEIDPTLCISDLSH